MQVEAPVDAMYVPAVHSEQVATDADVAPVCPYFPAEQSVPEQVEAPAAEYLPASQAMHLELAQSGVVHTKPASIVQVLLHPSPLTTLPSSQASYVFNPSPHAGVQSWHAVALHVCVQQTGQCIRGSVCVCAATVNECRHLSVIAFGCVCN